MSNNGSSNRGFWLFIGSILLLMGLFLPADVAQHIACQSPSTVIKGLNGAGVKAFGVIAGFIILGLHVGSLFKKKK